MSEELAISAKIGAAELAKMAVQAANKGILSAFNMASKIPELIKSIPSMLRAVFSKALNFIKSFGKSLLGVVKNLNVFSKLSSSLGNSFKRLGTTIKQALVGAAAEFLWGLIKDAWNDVVNWWYENAFEDGRFTFNGLLNGILDAVAGIGEWIFDHIFTPFFAGVCKVFGISNDEAKEMLSIGKDIFMGILNGIIDAVRGIGQWLNEHIFQPIYDGICKLFGIHSPSTVMAEMGGFLMDGLFNGINEKIGAVVDLFKGIFHGFTDFITGVFSGDWEKAWEGVKDIFKGIWNGVVSILEGAINLIIKALNWLISQMNKISFDVPDWVPLVGGKTFGINIPSISEVEIPRLDQGAVIPPNREFMAVLGDQRNGTNLEAPEELIRKIVREESGVGNEAVLELLQAILSAVKAGQVIMVGETVLGRTTIKAINGVNQAAGKQLLWI